MYLNFAPSVSHVHCSLPSAYVITGAAHCFGSSGTTPPAVIFVNSFQIFAALYLSAQPSGTFSVALVYMLLEKVFAYTAGGVSA